MNKLFFVLLLCGLFGLTALAQFTGPTVQWRACTVAEAREARWGSYITVTGHIVARQRDDYYTFRDQTGEIRVEIEDKVWQGRTVSHQTKVKLHAEVDRGVAGRYLWVTSLDIIEEQNPQSAQFGGVTANPLPSPTAISFQQAKDIALAQYPGTTLVEGELTRKGPNQSGPMAWDLKLSNGMAVYIDANSGAILEHERWRR